MAPRKPGSNAFPGYVPDRGDIVWIGSSPRAGRVEAKRRPGLVLSPSAYNSATGLALIVPITTKQKGYRFEVSLADSLDTTGVVISDQVRTFDWRARKIEFEEQIDARTLNEVLARIAALFGF